jgi:two-component system, NtrC family, nitrogen regulation sensor histidine kinase NtrY
MRHFYKNNRYLLIALPILIFTAVMEILTWHRLDPAYEAGKIYSVFDWKERQMEKELNSVIQEIKYTKSLESTWYLLNPRKYDHEDRAFSISKNDQLLYWSSSLIAFPGEDSMQNGRNSIIHLPTGWFWTITKSEGGFIFKGFILIKRDFPYHNKYIKDSFQKDFDLPEDYQIGVQPLYGAINISRPDGQFLFSVIPVKGAVSEKNMVTVTLLYFILLFLFLAQINQWLLKLKKLRPMHKFLIAAAIGCFTYLSMSSFEIPGSLFRSELFSPGEFAYGGWLSSLGEFLLLSVFMFYIAQSFFILFRMEYFPKRNFRALRYFVFLFAAFYFAFSIFLLQILLLNSKISLEFFSNLELSFINLFSFLCVSLHTLGFIIILIRIRSEYYIFPGYKRAMLYVAAAGILAYLLFGFSGMRIALSSFIYYLVMTSLLFLVVPEKIRRFKFTFLLFASIISAAYLNLFSHELSIQRKDNVQKLIAVNLASERDPSAEIFLSELDDRFREDSIINQFLTPPYLFVEPYFRNTYFTGFWRNYDLKVTVCNPVDSLLVKDLNLKYPCFDFFHELESGNGVIIPGCNFYYMDMLNGRISYVGELDKGRLKIFIQLYSKILPEGSGYPELLLDEKTSKESRIKDFSYAKYYKGQLVDRGGEYQYEMHLPKEARSNVEFQYYTKNDYKHISYHRGGNNYIIVSYAETKFIDQVKTFPYLFLLLFLIGMIVFIFNRSSFNVRSKTLDFRGKIQLTLILSLLGISTLVGIGLIIYNYNQFKNSLQGDLNDKLYSISAELSMRIGTEDELGPRIHEMLNDQLIALSDLTRTDINIYEPDGQLFATSRNEIYDRGLISTRIDPVAYYTLSIDSKNNFIHKENLGKMTFYSAYIPLYNKLSNLVGYLNLPYFARQDEFKRDVSAFIIAFSNVYILLILISLIVAIFIGNKLTLPLLKIEKNLKGIQLGKENAKIEYLGEDEIGRLAKEYNKKVDELAESADLLARTERELAWREMARQVAHEINNPLTPMKLNIQYLRRIKEQGSENFDEYFDQVSKTLIENIDVLSSIASSFSDFARMPRIQNELLDLRERVKEAALLFKNTPNVAIDVVSYGGVPIYIMADKDQFSRVLINLIKNGIQSIPRDREGHIIIELNEKDHHSLLTITDNGSGIPEELRAKLFEPSFTTKSSGMGLGLAISRRIIENFKGEIWFQTTMNVGTTFYIKIPLAEKS